VINRCDPELDTEITKNAQHFSAKLKFTRDRARVLLAQNRIHEARLQRSQKRSL
jgi:hypothetical protein